MSCVSSLTTFSNKSEALNTHALLTFILRT